MNKTITVIFRVDADESIGAGHVMRCLNLARELVSPHTSITFACREIPEILARRIRAEGHRIHLLKVTARSGSTVAASGAAPEDHSGDMEIESMQDFLQNCGQKPDWLVVDHYGLDREWEASMRPWVSSIAVIEDLAGRAHDCDLLLDVAGAPDNPGERNGLIPEDCTKLLGSRYCLIHKDFMHARRIRTASDKNPRKVLISFGGSDPFNLTTKVLTALKDLRDVDFIPEVIVGGMSRHLDPVHAALKPFTGAKLHRDTPDMAAIMQRADLAIGAGGGELWERACLGIPSIVISTASNQSRQIEYLIKKGAVVFLGQASAVSMEGVRSAVRRLLTDSEGRRNLSHLSRECVDGLGAVRVAGRILSRQIRFRRAKPQDSDNIFKWRNDDLVRRYSSSPARIERQDHDGWYKAKLSSPESDILIAELSGKPVAVLRYDYQGNEATISVYVVPGQGDRGFGTAVIKLGNLWLRTHKPVIRSVLAKVDSENIASIKAFQRCGFSSNGEMLRLDLPEQSP